MSFMVLYFLSTHNSSWKHWHYMFLLLSICDGVKTLWTQDICTDTLYRSVSPTLRRRSRSFSPQGAIALQLLRSYFLTSTHVNCSASSTIIALVTKIINYKLHDATGMSSSTQRKHNLSTYSVGLCQLLNLYSDTLANKSRFWYF